MPVDMSLRRFEELVSDALDQVPPTFADAMDNVVVLVEDKSPPVDLDPDEEAGVLKGIQEFKEGKGLPISRLRAKLRRHFR